MDAITQHQQELNRVRHFWVQSSDPVRRMARLRDWFRVEHRLLNEVLADPSRKPAPEIQDCHALLEALPEKWDGLSSPMLQAHLEHIEVLPDDLHHAPVTPARSSAPAQDPTPSLPEFLNRPDRAWERLIYRAALGNPRWSLEALDETLGLQEFAARAMDRENELSRSGVVLAVSCLTPSGDQRQWRWMHLVSKAPREWEGPT